MRGTTRGSVVLGLVLLVGACGTTPRAATPQTGGRAQPSTITGLTLTFNLAQPCYNLVPVTGGFVGRCISGTGSSNKAATAPALIRNDGAVTDLPRPPNFSRYFADDAGDLVVHDMFQAPLLVIEPTSGAVKKATPLPFPHAELIGVTGTSAIMGRGETDADGRGTGRVMAYDVSGAKKWDVPNPDFVRRADVRLHVEVTHAGVLVFEENEETSDKTAPRARMLRLDDGSTLWDGSGRGISVTAPERVGRTVLSKRVGRTVFYDDAGVPRSLATGAPTGRGAGPSPGAVAYEDDIILTNPLRRMTPKGKTVWTLQDTSGTPATDGKTLVVLGTKDLVVLDPATGRRLGQAPDPSAPLEECGTTELIVATPRVITAGACTRAGTAVYTVNM